MSIYALEIKSINKIKSLFKKPKFTIEFVKEGYGEVEVDKCWIDTFNPEVGDYFVGFLQPDKICVKKFWFECEQSK